MTTEFKSEKPMLVMVPKDATIREDDEYIYIKTPQQKHERCFKRGSIVVSYPMETGWGGVRADNVSIDELGRKQ